MTNLYEEQTRAEQIDKEKIEIFLDTVQSCLRPWSKTAAIFLACSARLHQWVLIEKNPPTHPKPGQGGGWEKGGGGGNRLTHTDLRVAETWHTKAGVGLSLAVRVWSGVVLRLQLHY